MPLKQGIQTLLERANQEIETLDAEKAIELHKKGDHLIVDVRESEELKKDGKIPGSIHVPRGMLEFRLDPDSPYHIRELSSGKKLIFHCALGARSALSTWTTKQMGIENVSHIGGGLKAWKEKGGPIETIE